MVDNLFSLRGFGKESLRFFAAFSLVFLVFCVNSVAEGKQSAQTQKLTVKAVQAVKQNQVSYAQSLVSKTGDSLANKIYHWMLFTTMKNAKWDMDLYVRLSKFVQQHPDWPSISKIALLAENVMPQNISNEEAIGWFTKYPPKTPNGMERYIDALMINGRTKEAKTFLEDWWASTLISRDQQREIFLKYGKFLTLDAHKKRFDALLSEGHYENARAIGRVLSNGYPELAEARIALAEGKGGATAAVARVPKKLQNDPGLLYERLHWRRKNNLNMEAMEILHNQPPVSKLRNKEDWWTERHIIIRRMLEQRNYKSAYLLAADHGLDEGTSYAEAQWLAGWLALRYMNKPSEAYGRFTALHEKVKTPVSKARAAYWSGRAAKAMGKKGQAQEWFGSAAQYKSTFYGQLAHAQLSSRMELPRDTVSALSGSDTGGFGKSDLIQAARIFHDAGMPEISGNFLQAFIAQQNSPKAYKYAAEMAVAMGDYNQAVKISKDASSKGYFMSRQSYPVMSNWTRNNNGVELAFVHAIIRQESVFDTHALSSAGAMGLMQLMPGTAKEVAGKLGVAYDKAGLMKRPEYNVRLGSSYLSRLLQRYDGNYAMAAAAYNAGPGRVNQWIGQFGDPRDSKVDLIDWIEMIPISETRNYVQRVLENVYVYRIRLKDIQGQPSEPLHVAFKENQ